MSGRGLLWGHSNDDISLNIWGINVTLFGISWLCLVSLCAIRIVIGTGFRN